MSGAVSQPVRASAMDVWNHIMPLREGVGVSKAAQLYWLRVASPCALTAASILCRRRSPSEVGS